MAFNLSDPSGLLVHLNDYVKKLGNGTISVPRYQVSDTEQISSILYAGFVKPNTDIWLVKKVDESVYGTTSVYYAAIDNNPSILTYADAWTNRLTLTYDLIEDIVI